jgi:hypothetical protein
MKSMRRLLAAGLIVAAQFHAASYAQTQNSVAAFPSAATSPLSAPLQRAIAIPELGFAEGVHFGALGGVQTLFFPVPDSAGVTSGVLSFSFDAAAPLEGRRSVLVTIGDRTAYSQAVPVGRERQVVELPLLPGDFAGRFVKVTIRYSGLLTNDRCVDLRLANDRFTILPDTTLRLTLAAKQLAGVNTVFALLPPTVALGVPDRKLTEREMAAAISAVRLMKTSGRSVEVVPLEALLSAKAEDAQRWQRGDVILAAPSDVATVAPNIASMAGGRIGKASVAALPDGPGLLLTGDDPQPAVNLLGSTWRMAAAGKTLRVSTVQPVERPSERLTFDRLGIATPESTVPDEAVWTANFNANDLPAGRTPAAFDLDIGVGANGNDAPAVINVFLNGRFLAGEPVSKTGIARVHATVPQGLVGLRNQVRVVVRQQPRGGDCTYQPTSFPAQLLGSSSIELRDERSPAQDFFQLAPAARDRLTVFVRDALTGAAQRTAIQTIGAVTADLAPADAPIVVKRIEVDQIGKPDSSFIAWGDFRFDDHATPVRIDRGNLLVRARSGRHLFDLHEAGDTLIAQLVTPSGTQPGVWLRNVNADESAIAPQTIGLDRGNVAFIGASGVALALSTERERLVEVVYPNEESWLDLLRRYRTWIIAAAWLALTIGVLVALARMHGRDRKGS